MLYRGKNIFVSCESSDLLYEVEFLASLAASVVLYAPFEPLTLPANVTLSDRKPTAVTGETRLTAVRLGDSEQPFDGAFLLKSAFSPTTLVAGLAAEKGFVQVDRNMATSIPGLFAAGDVTGAPFQYAKAAGEGNVAAFSVIRYLARK